MIGTLIDIDRLAESIFAVTEKSDNRFSQTFALLANMAEELSLPIAIVGGMAGIYHGSGVTTLPKMNAGPTTARLSLTN